MTSSTTPDRLPLYDATAEAASSVVISRYSTSFGLASRLLTKDTREHIRNVYALVRVADEVVDGPATEAGLDPELARTVLDELETDTERAMALGFSVNPVVHAFARSARTTGFGPELTRPFFASMRMDLDQTEHDQASFDTYVYGSAEVVGLMCLRAFVYRAGRPTSDDAVLVDGARALGAAFQKVNFLRDLHADFEVLGRSYFPGVDVRSFDEATKDRLVADVQADLDRAARTVPLLPKDARPAVALAHALFQELNDRIAATPAARLITSRVRVPNPVKARLAARVLARRGTLSARSAPPATAPHATTQTGGSS
ncbi:phytoene/squalene synthase family protein [Curtobacterium sp. MCBD17_008]|uniref:phytoene/squalene synthase family protein n=1 Tax=Curtobacterium sp. MCBD17_008 TaxID=2175656 RepID=UPI000DA90C36|nr:phytoene/squalene synthase family protein [Curtobacterium sp. MCBD17_008]PZE91708.1 phytoene/squalene synthase family protein [Curtobacterium sp. MCBD17_008]